MSYLSVTKWTRYQHYTTRRPPWIKYYVELVDDVQNKLNDLPVSTRYLFDRMLLLAAKYDNAIPNDSELIANLVRMPHADCREGIEQLLHGRWLKEKRTKRTASKRASVDARARSRSRSRKPLTPSGQKSLEAMVRNGGYEYTDVALREELLKKGADDLLVAKLLKVAAELRLVAS